MSNSRYDYSFLDKTRYHGVELLHLESYNLAFPLCIAKHTAYATTPHRHSYFQIIYVSRGSVVHVLDNNRFTLDAGDIFIVPPFVPHRCEKPVEDFIGKNDLLIYELEFTTDFLNEEFADIVFESSIFDFTYIEPLLLAENKITPGVRLSGVAEQRVVSLLEEILTEYNSRFTRCDCALMIRSLVMQLMVLLGRFYESQPDCQNITVYRHKEGIELAVKYIGENYCNACISIDELCRVSMMSASYLRCFFKLATGSTVNGYINSLRIEKAVTLLKDRALSITDIGFECGFQNTVSFNRVFKKYCNISPRGYRQTLRNSPRIDNSKI